MVISVTVPGCPVSKLVRWPLESLMVCTVICNGRTDELKSRRAVHGVFVATHSIALRCKKSAASSIGRNLRLRRDPSIAPTHPGKSSKPRWIAAFSASVTWLPQEYMLELGDGIYNVSNVVVSGPFANLDLPGNASVGRFVTKPEECGELYSHGSLKTTGSRVPGKRVLRCLVGRRVTGEQSCEVVKGWPPHPEFVADHNQCVVQWADVNLRPLPERIFAPPLILLVDQDPIVVC